MWGRIAPLIGGVRPFDVAKNVLAPLGHNSLRRSCFGMDGDPVAVVQTLGWLVAPLNERMLHMPGLDVLELGPGRTPELLAGAVLLGANSGLGVDTTLRVGQEPTALASYAEVAALLASGAHDALLARFGVDARAVDAQARRFARERLPISFVRYDGERIPARDSSIDLVLSKSVLEHVRLRSVRPLLHDLRRVLRPGGLMLHIVDLRDHLHIEGDAAVTGDWLEMLRASPTAHAAMFSRRSTYVNRLRAYEWREVIDEAGLAIEGWSERRLPIPRSFDRSSLQPRWRDRPTDELAVGHIAFAARASGDALPPA